MSFRDLFAATSIAFRETRHWNEFNLSRCYRPERSGRSLFQLNVNSCACVIIFFRTLRNRSQFRRLSVTYPCKVTNERILQNCVPSTWKICSQADAPILRNYLEWIFSVNVSTCQVIWSSKRTFTVAVKSSTVVFALKRHEQESSPHYGSAWLGFSMILRDGYCARERAWPLFRHLSPTLIHVGLDIWCLQKWRAATAQDRKVILISPARMGETAEMIRLLRKWRKRRPIRIVLQKVHPPHQWFGPTPHAHTYWTKHITVPMRLISIGRRQNQVNQQD